ncbi:MAG: hypothetical protein KGL74_02230 [Elusimicrobia bacterium]|nr:hypothetical protein [Elusimicrobiota bacterium]MDE2509917.1 hypothetical protein [Elusimicrobiota bacterium]
MIRALSAAMLLAAVSVSAAPPALPSFEAAAGQIQNTVAALRAASAKASSTGIGARLDSMAWDLQNAQQDVSRQRSDLRFLMSRVNGAQPGQPDQNLRWELQRLNQDLASLARDAGWRLDELRSLSAQAQKDPTLVGPATRLTDAARWLKSETNWLTFDARFASIGLLRAGLTFESMDLDRNGRDLDDNAAQLQTGADALLAKVR